MIRGILIAGNESSLTQAIAAEAARRVEHFVYTLIPGRPGPEISVSPPSFPGEANLKNSIEQETLSPAAIPLTWNPGSPISARTLLLGAENRLSRIDEAILVCVPPALRCRPAELPPAEVETMVEENIKGWFFLVRELALFFTAKKSGTLALALNEIALGGSRDDAADLLGPAAAASFGALTRGVLASAPAEPWLTMGFSSSETGDEKAFASFIWKRLDESSKRDSGKLHKYGKLNLFR
jgi:NAD(P)-dependent dehydrogenase (short-subunit alcohol dehydrogenase family)